MKERIKRFRCTQNPQVTGSTYRQVERFGTPDLKSFKRRMKDKEVNIEIFMLEDESAFGNMPEREKMKRLMSSASQELKA